MISEQLSESSLPSKFFLPKNTGKSFLYLFCWYFLSGNNFYYASQLSFELSLLLVFDILVFWFIFPPFCILLTEQFQFLRKVIGFLVFFPKLSHKTLLGSTFQLTLRRQKRLALCFDQRHFCRNFSDCSIANETVSFFWAKQFEGWHDVLLILVQSLIQFLIAVPRSLPK